MLTPNSCVTPDKTTNRVEVLLNRESGAYGPGGEAVKLLEICI